jgi:hypothetical protein
VLAIAGYGIVILAQLQNHMKRQRKPSDPCVLAGT